MKTSRIVLPLAFAAILTTPTAAHGYDLYLRKHRVHEVMTEQSALCFASSRGASRPVTDCRDHLAIDGSVTSQKYDQLVVPDLLIGGASVTYRDLKISVRWPDDPQRKLRGVRGFRSAMNFGGAFRLVRYCKRHKDRGEDVNGMGLLCASHYGDMQFLHSMASSDGEATARTREKIVVWARFAYDYATGVIPNDDAKLCDVLLGYPEIRDAIVGDEQLFICAGDKRGERRTVGWFFGFECRKTFSSALCHVDTTLEERRAAALGAILHLIQDSYSQSHVQRGRCADAKGTPEARIRLAAVERYLDYSAQDSKKHSESDDWPEVEDAGAGIDHPVVAGARVLEMVADGKSSVDLEEYLLTRVLRPADPAPHSGSGPGDCYMRRGRGAVRPRASTAGSRGGAGDPHAL